MKTIQIYGSYHQVINEDASSWFSSLVEPGGWFGNFCSNLFGTPKGNSEKMSEYERARQEGIKAFKKQREDEIKAKIEHEDKIRAENLRVENAKKLNQMKAKEAERKAKRDEELNRAKRIQAELKRESDRIDAWTKKGAPKDPQELEDIMNTCNKIAQELPDHAQMMNNFAGMLNDMCYDKNGKFIDNPSKREKAMKDKYGDDWRDTPPFNDPTIKSQIESFEKERDKDLESLQEKTGKDLEKAKEAIINKAKKSCMKVMPGYSELQTPEQEKQDMKDLEQIQDALNERDIEIQRAQDALKEEEKNLEDLKNLEKKRNDLEKAKTNAENDAKNPKKLKEKLGDLFKDEKDEQENVTPVLNPKSKAYKFLQEAGLSEEEIEKLTFKKTTQDVVSKLNGENSDFKDQMTKVSNAYTKEAREALDKFDNEHPNLKDAIDTSTKAIEGDKSDPNNPGLKQQVENAKNKEIKIKDKEGKEKAMSNYDIRMKCGKVSDSGPITTQMVGEALEKKRSEQTHREKQFEAQKQAFQQAINHRLKDKENQDMLNKLGDDKEEVEKALKDTKPQEPKINKDEESGDMTIEVNGKEVKISKPQEPQKPADDASKEEKDKYKEDLAKYNQDKARYDAIDKNPNLLLDAGEEPQRSTFKNDKEYLLAHKQWEVNKEAHAKAKDNLNASDSKGYDDTMKSIEQVRNGEYTPEPKEKEPKQEPKEKEPKQEPKEKEPEPKQEPKKEEEPIGDITPDDFNINDEIKSTKEKGVTYEKDSNGKFLKLKDGFVLDDDMSFDDWLKEVEDNTNFSEDDLKDMDDEDEDEEGKAKQDPHKVWKQKTYKKGKKTFKTKSYYNKKGDSISKEEFQERVANYEKSKNGGEKTTQNNEKTKEPTNTQSKDTTHSMNKSRNEQEKKAWDDVTSSEKKMEELKSQKEKLQDQISDEEDQEKKKELQQKLDQVSNQWKEENNKCKELRKTAISVSKELNNTKESRQLKSLKSFLLESLNK